MLRGTRLNRAPLFAPHGIWGFVYWNGRYHFHKLIFASLLPVVARVTVATDPTAIPGIG